MNIKQQMDCLFDPRSVAVIGASNDMMKWGFNILNILLTRGGREIYAINRNGAEVQGLKAYRSIGEVPGLVDVAVITVPFQDIPTTMEECVSKGVKAAIVISGGLAETGAEGASVERKAVEIARRGGMRFIGPNCMGNFNAFANFQTVPYIPPLRKGPLSLISQSGNTSQSIVYLAHEVGLGFSKYVSSGNEADLHLEDYLEYFAQDENTQVILGYVEGIREGRRFFELAKEITRKKPVVILKAGRTAAGTRAVMSHTASLAGSDTVTDAALKQCGVIRVDEVSELVDVALALLGQPLPRGKRVGVLSSAGGAAVMAADALMRQGLELPALSPATIEKLNSILSRRWSRGNPIDNGGDPFGYESLWALMEDENIDSAVIYGAAGIERNAVASWFEITPAFRGAVDEWIDITEASEITDLEKLIELSRKYRKPAVYCNLATPNQKKGELYEKLEHNYYVPFLTPERAARVLAHLVEYSEYLGIAGGRG
ncbi:acetate--CoA ligase family protein [Chloroflexota bacterium]